MIAIALLVGGCGGTSLLTGPRTETTRTSTRTSAARTSSAYLAALGTEQRKLAAAEQAIPRSPRTPRALAHAISLLHAAIERLAADLAALRAPRHVRALHARLVLVMRTYAARLGVAAGSALRPGHEALAASELLAATAVASRSFSATIGEIDRRLMP